ncbi:MAG: cytidine deaminase [Bacteroidales bacterium]|jgi:cytidine deaminase|nr:cytidine deaminase [Bacteroidales bacterium]
MKTIEIRAKIRICSHSELSVEQKNVVEAAKRATSGSYSPYSNFKVGAAVLLANGEIITGSNQENAAYPSGLCAERTAIFYAGANYPDVAIRKLAIISRQGDEFGREICSPCGACRQVICEAEARAGAPIEILLCSATEAYIFDGIDGLLPFGFSGKDLQCDAAAEKH